MQQFPGLGQVSSKTCLDTKWDSIAFKDNATGKNPHLFLNSLKQYFRYNLLWSMGHVDRKVSWDPSQGTLGTSLHLSAPQLPRFWGDSTSEKWFLEREAMLWCCPAVFPYRPSSLFLPTLPSRAGRALQACVCVCTGSFSVSGLSSTPVLSEGRKH